MRLFSIMACLLLPSAVFADDDVLVAVASNFAPVAEQIAERFTQQTGVPVRLSAGATGRLYAQIVNGAPYDVFLSADVERPERLLAEGRGQEGSDFVYALGQLMLWSGDPELGEADCVEAFKADRNSRLSIANPRLAPYGLAAQEWLKGQGLYQDWQDRIVIGENIAQTSQFAVFGGARFGLLAASQSDALPATGCRALLEADDYPPVRQGAVLLSRAVGNESAVRFLGFLREEARPLILASGYGAFDD